jgi:hypothetical protein
MNLDTLKQINQIIKRDSKDTTYKFALLRGTIEVIEDKTPYANISKEQVSLPLGLLVFKWIIYYYPIIEAELPQKSGDDVYGKSLAFRALFKEITGFYADKNGLSAFHNDFMKGRIDNQIVDKVFQLCKVIQKTITTMPMKYIGYSIFKDHYKIFKPIKTNKQISKPKALDLQFLLENFGEFTIPFDYYLAFEYLGSFITGSNAILLAWAEFTHDKSKGTIPINTALEEILKSPVIKREVTISNSAFRNLRAEQGGLECVWSGKTITTDLNIEHMIPFAIWKNNDLWNLLPATATANSKKNDKIPSEKLLNTRKECIIGYWQYIYKQNIKVFERELRISLLNQKIIQLSNWENIAFDTFKEKCKYLIDIRGFEEWNHH